jgi:hypothetical protein
LLAEGRDDISFDSRLDETSSSAAECIPRRAAAVSLLGGAISSRRHGGRAPWQPQSGRHTPQERTMPLTPLAVIHTTAVTAGQIVSHTPVVVWAVLAGLIVLGASQARARRVGLARATALPLAMVAMSLWGTASLFGSGAHLTLVLASWLAAAAAAFVPVMRLAAAHGTQFDAGSNSFVVPGSWMPMLLIAGVFALRYATNVALALQPALAADATFAAGVAALSGLFTGVFGGRAARLWRLAQQRAPLFAANPIA